MKTAGVECAPDYQTNYVSNAFTAKRELQQTKEMLHTCQIFEGDVKAALLKYFPIDEAK